jgi:shikimate kinase
MNHSQQNDAHGPTIETLRARLGARAIALIGMPGSGKSSIGRRLAPRLGLAFVDADAKIEEAAGGMTVADIFERHGEAEFRALEARVIARLLDAGPAVIATGGGALTHAGTRSLIHQGAVCVWLKAEISVLLRRVRRKSDRPLLKVADPEERLKELLAQREPLYAEAAIVVASREGPHEAVVDSIIEALNNHLAREQREPARADARP